jgi:hypothetical protein
VTITAWQDVLRDRAYAEAPLPPAIPRARRSAGPSGAVTKAQPDELLKLRDQRAERDAQGHYTSNAFEAFYAVTCIDRPFDGLGLRGNDSAPVRARGVKIPAAHRLGDDGAGFGIMMGTVLPTFSVLIASGALGLAESLVQKTAEHASGQKYAHLQAANALADLPTIRAYVARMRIQVDMAKALWNDAIAALATGRADAGLRVLEVKAAAAAADPADRIVVFGSFFTVGGVLKDGLPRLAARHLG